MPVDAFKNKLYALALPLLGAKPAWKPSGSGREKELQTLLYRHHTIGAGIQRFHQGKLADCFLVGAAGENRPVDEQTVFRSASLAKPVTALLVFRLQSLGLLQADEDISRLWGKSIRHPSFPNVPITLAMLLSHTSSLTDSSAYFSSFGSPVDASDLLANPASWLPRKPGTGFRYSNFAAGFLGCLLEKHFGQSIEALFQEHLFKPLKLGASFDLSRQSPQCLADNIRVLPKALAFDAVKRIETASSLELPNPERHYLPCAGGLFIRPDDLAVLALTMQNGSQGFISEESLKMLQTPVTAWNDSTAELLHGMGLFRLKNPQLYPDYLWGHQGMAYGAVNLLIFDQNGNGFISLTSGADELRHGHLTRLNLDLIRFFFQHSEGREK